MVFWWATVPQRLKRVLMDVYVEDSPILSQHSFEYNLEYVQRKSKTPTQYMGGFKAILSKAESPSCRSMMYLLRNNVRADL